MTAAAAGRAEAGPAGWEQDAVRLRTVARRLPRHVGRRLAALGVGVVLALGATILVLALGEASPPPGQVLDGARRFAAGAETVSYQVSEKITSPGTVAGEQIVRTRLVDGRDRFAEGADFTMREGNVAAEYRSVATTPGVWIRAAATPAGLAASSWAHAPGYAVFETDVAGSGAGLAALLDTVSDGGFVRSVLARSVDPVRAGTSVRTLEVRLPPAAFGRQQAPVRTSSAVVVVDEADRPTAMTVTVQTGSTSVVLAYALVWNTAVAVVPPAGRDVRFNF